MTGVAMTHRALYVILDSHVRLATETRGELARVTYWCLEGDASWHAGPPPGHVVKASEAKAKTSHKKTQKLIGEPV